MNTEPPRMPEEDRIRLQNELEIEKIKAEAERKSAQAVRDADIAAEAAKRASKYALEKAKWDNEHALHKAFHEAILEVSKGSLERSRSGAEFVEKAAAAIGVIYASILGLTFVAGDHPLPPRGAIPALFLGIALAFAAAYLAFLKQADSIPTRAPASTLRGTQENRTFFFDKWMRTGALSRRYAARAAVLALGAGVLFLPAPFVGGDQNSAPIDLPVEKPVPDEEIDDEAQRNARFEVDLKIYEAHALTAIERSNQSLESRSEADDDSRRFEILAWVLAAIALAIVLGGPWAYEKWFNK